MSEQLQPVIDSDPFRLGVHPILQPPSSSLAPASASSATTVPVPKKTKNQKRRDKAKWSAAFQAAAAASSSSLKKTALATAFQVASNEGQASTEAKAVTALNDAWSSMPDRQRPSPPDPLAVARERFKLRLSDMRGKRAPLPTTKIKQVNDVNQAKAEKEMRGQQTKAIQDLLRQVGMGSDSDAQQVMEQKLDAGHLKNEQDLKACLQQLLEVRIRSKQTRDAFATVAEGGGATGASSVSNSGIAENPAIPSSSNEPDEQAEFPSPSDAE
jgi:hypothetical protein